MSNIHLEQITKTILLHILCTQQTKVSESRFLWSIFFIDSPIGYLLDDEVTQLNQAIQGTNVANDEVSEDGANNILFGVEWKSYRSSASK